MTTAESIPRDGRKDERDDRPDLELLDVAATAKFLGVSESWVRRHVSELPTLRVGRLIRFDRVLLSRQLQAKIQDGKSLRPERTSMLSRYQRGYVFQSGKKAKVWYGIFREDIRNPDGEIERRQRKIRLGSLVDLPTKNAARDRLSDLLRSSSGSANMSFQELTERWEKAEGVTMKTTTRNHYQNALRSYVLPTFGARKIGAINREDVQMFLADQARRYSQSSLRSMKVVLGLTLGWAFDCGWLSKNPCTRMRLPRRTGGRTVTRSVLTVEEINALAEKLKEPYATLVLFLAASGTRIGEAIALKGSDFSSNVVHITRRICDGDVDAVKSKTSERKLPLDPMLVSRIERLGKGDWVFRSRTGTPVNPGNALKRYVRPVAKELGIRLGGWHDFRHTLTTTMRRNSVHPKVISSILGHSRVNLAMDTYDRTTTDDLRQPLAQVAGKLLPTVTKNNPAA